MEEKTSKKSTQSNIFKIVIAFLGTLVIFVGSISIYGKYQKNSKEDTDAYKFELEYEKYNGKTNAAGTKYPNVDISDNNIIKYATVDEVIDNKLVKTDAEGKGYYELLDALDSILSDYIVYDSNNTSYETGEKRLYAPTVVFVKDGSIVANHVGTVTLPNGQTAYDSLTKTQKKELYNTYIDYIDAVYLEYCDDAC